MVNFQAYMAEEDEALEDIPEEEEEGAEGTRPSRKKDQKKKPSDLPCNPRIDELATPSKRIFLALWNEHAYHFPKNKVNRLKQLLQQLYAMSPEETAKYFAELRAEAKAAAMRKKLKQKLRKYLQEKHHQKQRECAYKLFKRLLKCGITYAAENPVPPVVSIRLRYLSDIILEQLCDLRKLGIPNRSNTDKLGNFMISIADWMAIAVERLYYSAQLTINAMTEEPLSQPDESSQVTGTYKNMGQPLAQSSAIAPAHTKQDQKGSVGGPTSYKEMGRPLAQSSSLGPMQTNRDQSKTVGVPASYRDTVRSVAQSSRKEAQPSVVNAFPSQNETEATTSKQPREPYYSFIGPQQKYLPTTPMSVSGMEQSGANTKMGKSKDDTGYSSGYITATKTQGNKSSLWGDSFH